MIDLSLPTFWCILRELVGLVFDIIVTSRQTQPRVIERVHTRQTNINKRAPFHIHNGINI